MRSGYGRLTFLATLAIAAIAIAPLASGQLQDQAPRPAIPLPADFPKDVPLPKDAKPVEARKRPDGTYHLKLQSPAALAGLAAYYAKQLPVKGWTITSQRSPAGGTVASIIAEKNGRTAAIGIFPRDGFRQISLEVDPVRKP
jgi:hypothetical protein